MRDIVIHEIDILMDNDISLSSDEAIKLLGNKSSEWLKAHSIRNFEELWQYNFAS